MFNRLKKLIENHYYSSGTVAQEKADTLYSYDKLTTAEYNQLTALISTEYAETEADNGTENA